MQQIITPNLQNSPTIGQLPTQKASTPSSTPKELVPLNKESGALYAHITERSAILFDDVRNALQESEAEAFEANVNASIFAKISKYRVANPTATQSAKQGIERLILQQSDILDDAALAASIARFIQTNRALSATEKEPLQRLENNLLQPFMHLDIAI